MTDRKSIRMGEAFDLQMGKTPSRDNPVYWGGTETWISIGDMGKAKYLSSSKEQITDTAIRETGIKLVPKKCVIMSFKLSLGKVAITLKPLYTNEAIMAFIIRKEFESEISPEFLYYYLQGYK